MDYIQTVESFKKLPKSKQLSKVNFYLNQLLPQYDDVTQKKEDYWSTPKEFLITGFGDCEDYAIIKYFTLIKLGFSKDKLFITTVNEKFTGGYHMVLSYFQNSGASPLILDNLSFRVLDLKTRNDLQADTFTNHSGVYKLNSKNKLIKIYDVSSQFQDLINRVKKEN